MLLGMLLFTIYRLTIAGFASGSPLRYRIYCAACLAVLILSIVESILAGLIVAHTMLSTAILATAWNMKTPTRSRNRNFGTSRRQSFNGGHTPILPSIGVERAWRNH
jgi:MFS superfamily sulfate permease-like transporter